MTRIHHGDDATHGAIDDVLAEVVAEVRADGVRLPSARAARQRQAIANAIAAEHRGRLQAISPAAAAVLALGVAGAAIAGTVAALSATPTTPSPSPLTATTTPTTAVVAIDVAADSVGDAFDIDDGADDRANVDVKGDDVGGGRPAAVVDKVSVHKTSTPRTPAEPLAPSLDALVAAALDGGRGDVLRLGQRFAEDPVGTDDALAIAAAADGNDGVRARRLRCELQLRFGRTAAALEVCRAYVQQDGDDDGARPLAFGAGGLAEELGLLDDATRFYTNAIVLSPLSGAASYDALKARARVHARAGRVDDARADLRLFMEARSAAALDDDVVGLATRLGLELRR